MKILTTAPYACPTNPFAFPLSVSMKTFGQSEEDKEAMLRQKYPDLIRQSQVCVDVQGCVLRHTCGVMRGRTCLLWRRINGACSK